MWCKDWEGLYPKWVETDLQTLQKLEENKIIDFCLPMWENQTGTVKKSILNLRNRSSYWEQANKVIPLGNIGLC